MKKNSWDKLTRQELNCWLEENWADWLPDILMNMINDNKPHALADLKYEIKQNYKRFKAFENNKEVA